MSSVLVPNQISLIVNSNPADGAKNLSADGSTFQVSYEDGGLQIPADALNTTISVQTANIWFSTPNIFTGKNDKMYVTGDNTSGVLTNFVLTIPRGLYDLPLLNNAIQLQLENQQAKTNPSPLISISADEATAKVNLRFNYANVQVDFRPTDTFRDILGFNSGLLSVATAPQTIPAQNVAKFNTINSYLIHSDLVNNGIRYNNIYNQTIGEVLIDVAPQEQINSQPFNPATSDASDLRGVKRNNVSFWLTDENNKLIDTNTEYWGARILIRYDEVKVLT
tara:strand:- start:2139 stop:2975 length:837 start_codon:yes stop_codon:yes gene_type:complete